MNNPTTTATTTILAQTNIDSRAVFTVMPECAKITDGCGSYREFPLTFNGADKSRTLGEVVDGSTAIRIPARGTRSSDNSATLDDDAQVRSPYGRATAFWISLGRRLMA